MQFLYAFLALGGGVGGAYFIGWIRNWETDTD